MSTFHFNYSFPLLVLLVPFFLFNKASAQVYNAVDWGIYFNDNAHFPNNDFGKDDWIEKVLTDHNTPESVYVVGKTSATSSKTFTFCPGKSIKLSSSSGFLAKYSACGDLAWSTYIGSYAYCLALDVENGKKIIYVGGNVTGSGSSQAFACDGDASQVFQLNKTDNVGGFIAKYEDLDTAVALLRWTYFSGSDGDQIFAIKVYNHNLFVSGTTESPNLDNNALYKTDSIYDGGGGDSYLARFNSSLSSLIFFTYIGADGQDRTHGLDIYKPANDSIDIFVTGTTSSTTGIASGKGFDLTYNSTTDAFIQKWEDNNGDGKFTLKWGTYAGGSSTEHGRASAVDASGNIFLTGFGSSPDLPVTSLAFDKVAGNPGSDGFIFKVSNKGKLKWCTYFGGNNDDVQDGLEIMNTPSGKFVVVAGVTLTTSSGFDLVNPIQHLLNGDDTDLYYDGYIAILSDVSTSQQQLVFSTYLGGSNEEGIKTGYYHPTVALGVHNEIYYAGGTSSTDFAQVIGSAYQHALNAYSGGNSDGYLAKLIDANDPTQSNCLPLRAGHNALDPTLLEIKISPNPSHETVIVQINALSDEPCTIKIFNALGSLIYIQDVEVNRGQNSVSISLKNIPSGLCLVRINQGEEQAIERIIKL